MLFLVPQITQLLVLASIQARPPKQSDANQTPPDIGVTSPGQLPHHATDETWRTDEQPATISDPGWQATTKSNPIQINLASNFRVNSVNDFHSKDVESEAMQTVNNNYNKAHQDTTFSKGINVPYNKLNSSAPDIERTLNAKDTRNEASNSKGKCQEIDKCDQTGIVKDLDSGQVKDLDKVLDKDLDKILDKDLHNVPDKDLDKVLDTALDNLLDKDLDKTQDKNLDNEHDKDLDNVLDKDLDNVLDKDLDNAQDKDLDNVMDNDLDNVLDNDLDNVLDNDLDSVLDKDLNNILDKYLGTLSDIDLYNFFDKEMDKLFDKDLIEKLIQNLGPIIYLGDTLPPLEISNCNKVNNPSMVGCALTPNQDKPPTKRHTATPFISTPLDSTHVRTEMPKGINLAGIQIPFCQNEASCLERCYTDSVFVTHNDNSDSKQIFDFVKKNIFNNTDSSQNIVSSVPLVEMPFSNNFADYICRKERSKSFCNCDPKCLLYGDCCSDVFSICWDLFDSDSVELFINQTYSDLSINTHTENIIRDLRDNFEDPEKLVDYLYANYGSCQVVDSLYERRMMFISRCPDTADLSLRQSCEGNKSNSSPPVNARFGNVTITFFNKFCAECHGLANTEYTAWTRYLRCNRTLGEKFLLTWTKTRIDLLRLLNVCNIIFTDPLLACQERSCIETRRLTSVEQQQVSLGVTSGACRHVDALLCRSYYFPTHKYKNPHCQKCLQPGRSEILGFNDSTTVSRLTSETATCTVIYDNWGSKPQGVFLILDLSGIDMEYYLQEESSRYERIIPESAQCAKSEVFDPVSETCKTLLCPLGHIPERDSCVPFPSTHSKASMRSRSQEPTTEVDISVWTFNDSISCQVLTSEMPAITLLVAHFHVNNYALKSDPARAVQESRQGHNQTMCRESVRENSTTANITQLTLVQIKITLTHDLDLVTWMALKQLAENTFPGEYHMDVIINEKYDLTLCPSGSPPNYFTPVTIEESGGILHASVQSRDQKLYYPLQHVAYRRRFTKLDSGVVNATEIIMVCEASKLFLKQGCSVVAESLNETTMNITQFEHLYGLGNVDIQEDKIYVCIQQNSDSPPSSIFISPTFRILSWILSGISMSCLSAMLILYYLFPELRNLPGKMTASLAATMLLNLLSSSLSLVELQHRYICPVVAVVNHVMHIAQCGWMTTLAINMAVTFGGKTRKIMPLNKDASFLKYAVLVWGLSVAVVTPPVILDILHDDTEENGTMNNCSNITSTQTTKDVFTREGSLFTRYGMPVCVWFSGPSWVHITFSGIPFFISFTINVICFAITLIGIHRTGRHIQAIGQKSHRRLQCVIYLKLSTAMGFTTVLSIIGNIKDINNVVLVLVTAIILLQGVFLFVAFMVNRRVFALMKKRFNANQKSVKSTTSSAVTQ